MCRSRQPTTYSATGLTSNEWRAAHLKARLQRSVKGYAARRRQRRSHHERQRLSPVSSRAGSEQHCRAYAAGAWRRRGCRIRGHRICSEHGRSLVRRRSGGSPLAARCSPGLFALRGEDAPTPAMVAAAGALLRILSPAQRAVTCYPVDSQLWRHWQNTELYVEHHGLRLDEAGAAVREAVLAVLRASLSGKGFEITRGVMQLNRFLGDLVGGPAVLGEWAYIFLSVRRAVGVRAVGLAAVWASSEPELFCDRPADGADAVFFRRRAELCRHRAVRRHPSVRGRGARGARADALAVAAAAAEGDRGPFDDGRRSAAGPPAFRRQSASRRRVSGQPHRAVRGPSRIRTVGVAAARSAQV